MDVACEAAGAPSLLSWLLLSPSDWLIDRLRCSSDFAGRDLHQIMWLVCDFFFNRLLFSNGLRSRFPSSSASGFFTVAQRLMTLLGCINLGVNIWLLSWIWDGSLDREDTWPQWISNKCVCLIFVRYFVSYYATFGLIIKHEYYCFCYPADLWPSIISVLMMFLEKEHRKHIYFFNHLFKSLYCPLLEEIFTPS